MQAESHLGKQTSSLKIESQSQPTYSWCVLYNIILFANVKWFERHIRKVPSMILSANRCWFPCAHRQRRLLASLYEPMLEDHRAWSASIRLGCLRRWWIRGDDGGKRGEGSVRAVPRTMGWFRQNDGSSEHILVFGGGINQRTNKYENENEW